MPLFNMNPDRTASPGSSKVFNILLVSMLCGLPGCSAKKTDPGPVLDPAAKRTVAQGVLIGGQDLYSSHSWRGIPFARPPVGDLRWKAPAPPLAWQADREAVEFGEVCTQLASAFGGAADLPTGSVRGSEDCLTLNVYGPRFAVAEVPVQQEALPVIVWIHGGANRSGGSDFYHGGNLAVTQNVIVVTVNYRLGPLGWFYHPALAGAANPGEQSGNFALLDLIAALEWIQENVAVFGGNPERVTIMGESAGANNVFALLLAPRARGLFQRAIMQSGLPRTNTREQASAASSAGGKPNSSLEISARLLVAEGKVPDLDAARTLAQTMPADELAAFLRSLSAGRVIDAYRENLNGENSEATSYKLITLIQDGVVLPPGDFEQMFRAGGSAASVPLLIGANRDEENLYLATNPKYLTRYFGLLPVMNEPVFYDAIGDHMSTAWRVMGVHRPARAFRAVNSNVFAYRFDWDEEPSILGTDLGQVLGAAHGFEIPFAFGHYRLGAADRYMFNDDNLAGREDISGAMMAYWAEFARTGNPGRGTAGKQTLWEAYGADERIMILDTTADGGRRMATRPNTRASVLKDIADDERLNTGDDRCRVYRRMVEKNRMLRASDLPALGCQAPES